MVSLEIHGLKISFHRNIFLSFYRNIVSRVNKALTGKWKKTKYVGKFLNRRSGMYQTSFLGKLDANGMELNIIIDFLKSNAPFFRLEEV